MSDQGFMRHTEEAMRRAAASDPSCLPTSCVMIGFGCFDVVSQ